MVSSMGDARRAEAKSASVRQKDTPYGRTIVHKTNHFIAADYSSKVSESAASPTSEATGSVLSLVGACALSGGGGVVGAAVSVVGGSPVAL